MLHAGWFSEINDQWRGTAHSVKILETLWDQKSDYQVRAPRARALSRTVDPFPPRPLACTGACVPAALYLSTRWSAQHVQVFKTEAFGNMLVLDAPRSRRRTSARTKVSQCAPR